MRRVEGKGLETIRSYFVAAAEVAEQALCLRARCGAVIVKDGLVIGEGYNAPPLHDETNRTCNEVWDLTKNRNMTRRVVSMQNGMRCSTHADEIRKN